MFGQAPLHAAAHEVAQVEDGRIGDRVNDAQAFFSPAQNTGISQRLEMTRDISLSQVGGFDQFGDILFAFLQGEDEFDPVRFAQDAKAGGNQLQSLPGQSVTRSFLGHGLERFSVCLITISTYSYIS